MIETLDFLPLVPFLVGALSIVGYAGTTPTEFKSLIPAPELSGCSYIESLVLGGRAIYRTLEHIPRKAY
jgi:hypothetical protein